MAIAEVENAAELAQWKGDLLSLDGLDHLDAETATELARWTGHTLELYGIEELDDEAAAALEDFQGTFSTKLSESLTWIIHDSSTAAHQHQNPFFSPQGHFLAALRAHSSTMRCIACGAQIRAFGADFASLRCLMNNPGS